MNEEPAKMKLIILWTIAVVALLSIGDVSGSPLVEELTGLNSRSSHEAAASRSYVAGDGFVASQFSKSDKSSDEESSFDQKVIM